MILSKIWAFLSRIFLACVGFVLPSQNPNKVKQEAAQDGPELDKWEQNIQLHKELKKGWDAQQQAAQLPISPLTEYCRDALGNVYYINAAGLDINVDRIMAIERAQLGVYYGIDDKFILDYFKQVDEAISKNNWTLVKAYHNELKTRREKLPAMQMLLHLACLYLYRHDENPYTLDLALQQEKVETAQRIPELRAFFLRLSWGMIVKKEQELSHPQPVWSSKNEPDFLRYLAGTEETRGAGLNRSN